MADLEPYHKSTGIYTLVRLGLWEQAKFHGAELYDDLHIYRDENKLYFSCLIHLKYRTERQRALLWVFE